MCRGNGQRLAFPPRPGLREYLNPALDFDISQLLGAGCHLPDVLDSCMPPLYNASSLVRHIAAGLHHHDVFPLGVES